MWEGRGSGAIIVGRDYLGGFSEKDIALLKTFAGQAVIASCLTRVGIAEGQLCANFCREHVQQRTCTKLDLVDHLIGSGEEHR